MQNNAILGNLIEAKVQKNSVELENIGVKVGKLYTDHGLPIDMALSRLPYTREQKISILDGVCQWLIEHKQKSGGTEASIERQRATNKRMLSDFIKTGETGIY